MEQSTCHLLERDEMYWIPLTEEQATDLLELLTEEMDRKIEDEYKAYRERLQALYDVLLLEVQGKR